MRILFVHDRFGAMAGAEVNLYLTANELKRRGHVVGLMHGPPTGKGEANWREIFESRFPMEPVANEALVESAITQFQPDAIYVHKLGDLEVLQALTRAECPTVRMVHDHDLYCLRSYKYSPFSRKICTRAAGWHCVFPCGAVLARSRDVFPIQWRSFGGKRKELGLNRQFARMLVATEYMKGELLRNGFAPERIEIHAPVPQSSECDERSSFDERNLIVYAGQIIRGKGVDVLLEALARVRQPFECVILGDGTYRTFCERLCEKLGLTGRVQFKGYLPSEKLKAYYQAASVAVVSSLWPEPFGAVGLEAMRFGLPVVAFDAGGIKEWLVNGQNGFLVPWRDRSAFAIRVEELLQDKALARKLGERGRTFARERFGFEQYISGLEGMFARLMEAPQTARVG